MHSFKHGWVPLMGWCAAACLTGTGCTGDLQPGGAEGPVANPSRPEASDNGRGKRTGWWRGISDAGSGAEPDASADAGATPEPVDAGAGEDTGTGTADAGATPMDSGAVDSGGTTEDAGMTVVDPPEDEPPPDGPCVQARRLWFEDFETGNYDRWSGGSYGNNWGPESGECRENGFSTDRSVSTNHSHRSEITCRSHTRSHRGYGGVQFDGDTPIRYTNRGVGIDAPHGVVISYWWWLDVPYRFGGGRWLSPFTVNGTCDWQAERVITLGLEDSSHRLVPAHIRNTGGTVTFEPDAPGFPMRTWARITIYLNYHSGVMHVWQNGQSVVHATFSRGSSTMCHFHWGAYASGDNDDIVLYEDDISVWKLGEAWTDFSTEPDLAGGLACR